MWHSKMVERVCTLKEVCLSNVHIVRGHGLWKASSLMITPRSGILHDGVGVEGDSLVDWLCEEFLPV